jgi:tetratricopeptide (TPR) repeat protein
VKPLRGSRLNALRAGAIWMCCTSSTLASGPAFAQAKAEPVNPPTDHATTWFEKGTSAHQAGKFAEAEEMFLKVWAVRKAWDVAANLGLAQVNLGKHAAAAEHLSFALRWFPASEAAGTRAVLERRLATSQAEVGALKIVVNVSGAEVRTGGDLKGTTPLDHEIFVAPGNVTVEVRKEGYETVRRTITIEKGQNETLSIELRPAATERSKVPAYVVGSVGLAGLVVGGALIGTAFAQRSDLAAKLPRDGNGNLLCARAAPDPHPECPALRAQATQLDAIGNAGIGTAVFGGIFVAGAVAYYLWPAAKASPSHSMGHILPVAGREGGGIVWMGSF